MKCGVVALVVIATFARTASASPIRLMTSSDACSLDALEPQLAALAGSDPVDANAAATARIDVSRDRGAYRAAITFDDGNGTVRGPRIVAAKSCRELVESVALVIAMALPELEPPVADAPVPSAQDPVAEDSAAEPSSAARVSPSPQVHEVVSSTNVHAVGEPVVRTRPTWFALIASGTGSLSSRGIATGVTVGARVQRGVASLGVELRADAPEQVAVGAMGQINVVRAQLLVAPCVHVGGIAGCVLGSVGTFRGSGDGLVAGRSAYTPLLAGGLRLAWEHALTSRLGVRVHLDVDALASTSRFDVDRMPVWVSPRFEAGTGIGIVARFP